MLAATCCFRLMCFYPQKQCIDPDCFVLRVEASRQMQEQTPAKSAPRTRQDLTLVTQIGIWWMTRYPLVLQAQWPHHVILRSSIIYGPNSPQPVSRRLFLQFVDGALRDGPPTTFFADEWRSPVYVHDICRICETLLQLGMLVYPLPELAAVL